MASKPIRLGLKIGALCLLMHPACGWPALTSFLYVPGIAGTSQVAGRAHWTDVLSFKFRVCHPAGNGDPNFTGLLLNKNVDATSPLLAQSCASGGYFPGVTLQVIQGATLQTYQIQLDNVWVNSVAVTNNPAAGTLQESDILRFGKITWTYTQYDASGMNPTNITTDYDLLYGKVPILLSASGVQNPGSGTMDVTWNARAGATYYLLGSPQVDGIYTLITTVVATNLGPMTVTVPATGDTLFYRIQDNP